MRQVRATLSRDAQNALANAHRVYGAEDPSTLITLMATDAERFQALIGTGHMSAPMPSPAAQPAVTDDFDPALLLG
jgi:hypothetical protein